MRNVSLKTNWNKISLNTKTTKTGIKINRKTYDNHLAKLLKLKPKLKWKLDKYCALSRWRSHHWPMRMGVCWSRADQTWLWCRQMMKSGLLVLLCRRTTGQHGTVNCSMCSPRWALALAWEMSGGFPTSATKMEEVGTFIIHLQF